MMFRLLLSVAQASNLDLSKLTFRETPTEFRNQIPLFILLGVVVVCLFVAILVYLRRRRRMREMNALREETRLHLLTTELNLGDTELELLETLVDSDDPADLIPLLESRADFETAVEAFRGRNPRHSLLRRTPQLRHRLHYGFNNIRNPFVDTRMLAPGVRMRCKLRLPQRAVEFLTTVMAVTEDQFYVRAPNAKGQPVSLGRAVNELSFRVSRENDAEYEFTCRVLGQTPNEVKAVMLEHTRGISRLLFRNAERVTLDIPTAFYVIRHEYAGEKSASQFKTQDSQYMFQGSICDLSIGGALVLADSLPRLLNEGDMVVFRLPDAQIKDDLVALVVGALPREQEQAQVHLQFVGMKELNRLKLSKYLDTLHQAPPAPPPGGDAPTPAAT